MSTPDVSGDRSFLITENDRRGVIMVVAIICCVYCPMILGLRAVGSLKNLGINDFLAIAALSTGLVEYSIVIAATSYGLGRSFDEVDEHDAVVVGKLVMASEILYFLTLALTKCSVAMLCRRLFTINMKKNLLVCDIAAGLCAIWGLCGTIAITAGCGPAQQIGYKVNFCSCLSDRWAGVAVVDAITEVVIFLLAVFVVVPLQVRFQRKAEVLASFLPRLFIIILIGLNAQSIHQQVESRNAGVSLTNGTVYRQVQMLFAIVTAALPALNRSLRLFHGSMGNSWLRTTSYSLSQSVGNSSGKGNSKVDQRGSGIVLRSLEPIIDKHTAESTEVQRVVIDEDAIRLRPDSVSYHFTASGRSDSNGADAESAKSRDSTGSKSRIIRMERRWHVRHEVAK